jgi:DNA-binding response OmpR family regulator
MKKYTILIIEDNADILENLTEYLEIAGFKTLIADNGKRGVEVAKEFVPDLIICDVLMSELDGYGVLRSLIEMDKTSEIPFIFSTSMSEKIDREESLKLGADDYIIKPFDPEILIKMANSLLKAGSKRRHTKVCENENDVSYFNTRVTLS